MLIRNCIARNSDAYLEEYKLIWPLWKTFSEAEDMYTFQPINCIASDRSQRTLEELQEAHAP